MQDSQGRTGEGRRHDGLLDPASRFLCLLQHQAAVRSVCSWCSWRFSASAAGRAWQHAVRVHEHVLAEAGASRRIEVSTTCSTQRPNGMCCSNFRVTSSRTWLMWACHYIFPMPELIGHFLYNKCVQATIVLPLNCLQATTLIHASQRYFIEIQLSKLGQHIETQEGFKRAHMPSLLKLDKKCCNYI
jgi:hypothetical protein